MMVRRYVAQDMPEAVVRIRKDLGKDAVILSTKRITQKKWLGLWRIKRIEVVAATGDDVPVRVRSTEAYDKATEAGPSAASRLPDASNEALRNPLNQTNEVAVAEEWAPKSEILRAENEAATAGKSMRVQSAASSVERTLHQVQDVAISQLIAEIAELKSIIHTRLGAPQFEASEHNDLLDAAVSQLKQQGIKQAQIENLLHSEMQGHHALSESIRSAQTVSEVKQVLGSRILDLLTGLHHGQPIASTSRLVALVGPTGVGKTTTVAKLAALQVLAGRKKVGLITTDTFRIAAIEQLRTYSGILNVPLEVVHQPQDFPKALANLSDRDLILVDTAGRNYQLEEHLAGVESILRAADFDETFLVLSMTSKSEDLDKLVAGFSSLPIDKFIFTKIDETSTYGTVFDLLLTYKKPLAYVTTGQNVPDDIEIASLHKLLQLVLGGVA